MSSLRIIKFGGLKPLTSDRNLADHMATIANDVDLSQGILKPWRTPRNLGAQTGKVLLVKKAPLYWNQQNCRQLLPEQKLLIISHCRYNSILHGNGDLIFQ